MINARKILGETAMRVNFHLRAMHHAMSSKRSGLRNINALAPLRGTGTLPQILMCDEGRDWCAGNSNGGKRGQNLAKHGPNFFSCIREPGNPPRSPCTRCPPRKIVLISGGQAY